jgi:hypothetical protein
MFICLQRCTSPTMVRALRRQRPLHAVAGGTRNLAMSIRILWTIYRDTAPAPIWNMT